MTKEKKNAELREVLSLSGIKQKEIAEEIGCSKETMNRQFRYPLELGEPETDSITRAIQRLLKRKQKDLEKAGDILSQFLSSGV